MYRALASEFALLVGLATAAPAQGLGTIYFNEDATVSGRYFSVGGDGSSPTPISALVDAAPSGRSDYPTGRLFQVGEVVGTIPGGTSSYADLVARDLSGGRVQLTAFAGHLYIPFGG